MEINDFTNLYTKQDNDDSVTSFQNEVGFSLVRKYPNTSEFRDKPLRIFIKVALLEKGLFYSVDMTKIETEGEKVEYIIQHAERSTKYTNFFSDGSEPEFVFDQQSRKIKHIKKKKEFTLNQFVDILEKNHLSDCLFWKRKANLCVDFILKALFWLSDRHYDKVKTPIDRYNAKKSGKPIPESEKSIEPFFKYFYISKNFIFLLLLVTFFCVILVVSFRCHLSIKDIWTNFFGEFTLSNPFVILLFFLTLFISEKISMKLNKKINDFLIPQQSVFSKSKENFIEKLHNYLYRNKFDLKI
ncbi:MAG: hypothetical protein AAB618_03135 [Patescibacteria group bacterium]